MFNVHLYLLSKQILPEAEFVAINKTIKTTIVYFFHFIVRPAIIST